MESFARYQSWALILVVLLALLGGYLIWNVQPQDQPIEYIPIAGRPTKVALATVAQGANPWREEKSQLVIENQNAWEKLLAEAPGRVEKEKTEVDFGKEMVIAVFAGTKSSGGHGITVTKVTESDSVLTVEVLVTSPGKNCFTTMMFTTPYHLVRIPKSSKTVEFVQEQKIQDCSK